MTKEKKDKFVIICETCDKEYSQECNGIGNLDWKCPNCGNDEETFIINYIPGDPNFYKRKVDIGMKSGNPNTAWKR